MVQQPSEKASKQSLDSPNKAAPDNNGLASLPSNDSTADNTPQQYYNDDLEDQINPISRVNTAGSKESLAEQDNLSRILTGRHSEFSRPIPLMGGDRDYPPMLSDQKIYKVDFDCPD